MTRYGIDLDEEQRAALQRISGRQQGAHAIARLLLALDDGSIEDQLNRSSSSSLSSSKAFANATN